MAKKEDIRELESQIKEIRAFKSRFKEEIETVLIPRLEAQKAEIERLVKSNKRKDDEIRKLKGETCDDEDGNIDYCMVCNQAGGLLCCDCCPRAFHPGCIGVDENSLPEGDWKCHLCTRDRDFIDAEDKLRVRSSPHSGRDKKLLELRALVIVLSTKIDFGYAFDEPVNLVELKDYSRVIERPISYSEIINGIDNGDYDAEPSASAEMKEAMIEKALIDINTVYQNCFRYNNEGSAIFKMAEIHEKNFNKLLVGNFFLKRNVVNALEAFKERQRCERDEYLKLCKKRADLLTRPLDQRRKISNAMYFQDAGIGCARLMPQCMAKGVQEGGGKWQAKRESIALVDYETGEFLDIYPSTYHIDKKMCFFNDGGKCNKEYNIRQTLPNFQIFDAYLTNTDRKQKKKGFQVFLVDLSLCSFMSLDVGFVAIDKGDGGGDKDGGGVAGVVEKIQGTTSVTPKSVEEGKVKEREQEQQRGMEQVKVVQPPESATVQSLEESDEDELMIF